MEYKPEPVFCRCRGCEKVFDITNNPDPHPTCPRCGLRFALPDDLQARAKSIAKRNRGNG